MQTSWSIQSAESERDLDQDGQRNLNARAMMKGKARPHEQPRARDGGWRNGRR